MKSLLYNPTFLFLYKLYIYITILISNHLIVVSSTSPRQDITSSSNHVINRSSSSSPTSTIYTSQVNASHEQPEVPLPHIHNSASNQEQQQQSRKRRSRFLFQPILTLTLKDPFAKPNQEHLLVNNESFFDSDENVSGNIEQQQHHHHQPSRQRRNRFWSHRLSSKRSSYANIFNLHSLAPTFLYSIRSKSKPLPNYIPSLHYTSVTAGYKYDDICDRPSFIEGEMKFRKWMRGMFGLGRGRKNNSGGDGNSGGGSYGQSSVIELDIGPRYCWKEKKMALVVRIGGESGGVNSGLLSTNTDGGYYDSNNIADDKDDDGSISTSNNIHVSNALSGGFGCYALARFAMVKGKKYLEHIRGSYKMNLPFTAVGSISITPSYDFEKEEPTCNIIGKSSSGRTAAVIDLNWENPTLSVVHALDESMLTKQFNSWQRNIISPEISLYDAKIIYNWSVALDSGAIKTRVDPSSAIQITWTDQGSNGKWVTDFKLPLVPNPGPLAGDIRVRRQFEF